MIKTNELKNIETMVNKVARGTRQRHVATMLLEGKEVKFCNDVANNITRFSELYYNSFMNMIERLENEGYVIKSQLGDRGGIWTSRYRIINYKKPTN